MRWILSQISFKPFDNNRPKVRKSKVSSSVVVYNVKKMKMLLGPIQFLNNSYELESSLFLYINLLLVTLDLHHFTKVQLPLYQHNICNITESGMTEGQYM